MTILKNYSLIFICSIAVVLLLVLIFMNPIPQDINYHNFADARMILSISNFWNVVSNLPFFFVGIYALDKLFRLKTIVHEKGMRMAFSFLFVGVVFVALGSGYYHLDPNNITLIWDRLPMTIAFMALFSILIAEYIDIRYGKNLLYPLLVLGIASVMYWAYTESTGQGDLRLYIFVQFYPMLAIPILLLQSTPTFTLSRGYWYLIVCYALAKVFEHYDRAIYEVLGFISGHSLKHMIAALGLYILLRALINREKIKETL